MRHGRPRTKAERSWQFNRDEYGIGPALFKFIESKRFWKRHARKCSRAEYKREFRRLLEEEGLA